MKKETTTTRTVGTITYRLTRKQVKNINLRVKTDGSVFVSAHKQVGVIYIDRFVKSREAWIKKAITRLQNRSLPLKEVTDKWSDRECLTLFEEISQKIYPLFEDHLPQKPKIKVKFMTSCWGVCHPNKNYITLNKALLGKPKEAIEYVVLHEYVHFLHPNHQKGFHDTMRAFMPDYKIRRALLK